MNTVEILKSSEQQQSKCVSSVTQCRYFLKRYILKSTLAQVTWRQDDRKSKVIKVLYIITYETRGLFVIWHTHTHTYTYISSYELPDIKILILNIKSSLVLQVDVPVYVCTRRNASIPGTG